MPWFRELPSDACRENAVQMPWFLITVPRLPWFWVTAQACRANAVIASNSAMIYRVGILCRGQSCKFWHGGSSWRCLKRKKSKILRRISKMFLVFFGNFDLNWRTKKTKNRNPSLRVFFSTLPWRTSMPISPPPILRNHGYIFCPKMFPTGIVKWAILILVLKIGSKWTENRPKVGLTCRLLFWTTSNVNQAQIKQ